MGYRTEIEVYHCVDLTEYHDDIMDYMEPDNINDAMDLMGRWGYSEGDIIEYMMEDPSTFLEKVSNILTVETALQLVKDVYEYGHSIQVRNLDAKSNQIIELKQRVNAKDNEVTELTLKIDELLALNHNLIAESNDDTPNV